MRVLVTGASGFVGSQVVRRCIERGFTPIASMREASTNARLEGVDGVEVVRADLGDADGMRRLASRVRPDVAIHAAWCIAPDVHDAPENLACVSGSLALLGGLHDAGCRRVLFVGTHLEYAASEADLVESSPIAPRGFYATCKAATHTVARGFSELHGLAFAWARLFNLYGPREAPWQLVPHVTRSLLDGRRCELGSGDDVRGFLHVDDAAAALVEIAASSTTGVFNVGSDVPITVRDLARRIAARTGGAELLSFGSVGAGPRDAPRVVPNVDRLRRELAFVPRRTLDDGLDETVAFWRTAGEAERGAS